MAIEKSKRLEVEGLILAGEDLDRLAEDYNIHINTLYSWRRRLQRDATENTDIAVLGELVDNDDALHTLAEQAKQNNPDMAEDIDKVVDGVVGFNKLDGVFQDAAELLIQKAKVMVARRDLTPKEWELLAKGIGNLYSSFYNKNVTNYNVVQQTNVNANKVSVFKGALKP